ncbi:MAG: NADH-quinone oxidoreductase subunit H [Sulfuricurvum sp. PC08-66]|nr:MAG: NADH-quinone oxidoreductase subunit H [Sulfuricurvum sp. PC08-66]
MQTMMTLLPIVLMVLYSLAMIPGLIWMERRIASMVQNRLGPNRCNIKGFRLGGVVQSAADVMKLIFKEEFYPAHVKNRTLYIIAPSIVFIAAFLMFAVIPFADVITLDHIYGMQALPIDLGILWYVALAGLGLYGIILAGWASHSKYGILSAMRASAQMLSYEISMGLAIVAMVITYDSVAFNDAVHFQAQTIWGFLPAWGIVIQPVAALIFIVTAFAETNRAPFDVAEGESELVAGYHTEYSAMKFALFFMAEYVAMTASSAVIVTLFLGGYNLPYLATQEMLEHPVGILVGTMVALGVLYGLFIYWIRTNISRAIVEDLERARERKVLTVLFVSMLILSELFLLYWLVVGTTPTLMAWLVLALQLSIFTLKFFAVIIFFILVRWTFMRFRYDQIQHLGWYILLPLALLNLLITALVVVL